MQRYLDIHPEVQHAVARGLPVVALESTIIAHGMPYPQNVATARQVEELVRDHGATPATIAVLSGRVTVGLSADQLEVLGRPDSGVLKLSRRDLPYAVAMRRHGATTVAATMWCAKLAGIRVFVTGGIGGVHKDGADSMDVSADLMELAHTSVAVVCAGAKSILDLGRTLEVLETHGVPVIGFGTDEFPAFYARTSGFGVSCRLDSPADIAHLLHAKWTLDLQGGAVIAVPIPAEAAIDAALAEAAINQALTRAAREGVHGKALTPYLLKALNEITVGKSLEANIALVRNNASVGARVAKAYAELP